MKDFEFFISEGEVRKTQKNQRLASSLIKESFDRINFIKRIKLDEINSKYIIENTYDVLRELIEAKLAIEGFKSYSHEATILFLKKFEQFKENEIRFLDDLRKVRHGIKYYGKNVGVGDAKKVLDFMNSILPKLKSLLKNMNNKAL